MGGNPPLDDPVSSGRVGAHATDSESGLPNDTIQGLSFDGKGRLWVATSGGAARFDGRGFTPVALPHAQRSNLVRCVLESRDGTVFFGRDDLGVVRWRDGIASELGRAQGLPHDRVNVLYEAQPGGRSVLYAGTYGGGLARLDGAVFRPVGDRAPLPRIWALVESDVLGTRALFVGGDGGLFRQDGDRWVEVALPPEARGTSINSLVETKDASSRSVLWAGCYGRGVLRIDASGVRLLGAADGLTSLSVTSVAVTRRESGETALFAGTRSGGVHVFDGTRFEPVPLGPRATEVYRLAGDDEGSLWVGTRGSGLLRLKSRSWRTVDTLSGLPGNNVWGLAEAPNGERRELWVATSRGAAYFRGGRWNVLDARNGLPASDISSLAVTTASGGTPASGGRPIVWLGTLANGLVRIDGDRMQVLDRASGFYTDRPIKLAAYGETLFVAGEESGPARLDGERVTRLPPPPGETWGPPVALGVFPSVSGPALFVGLRDGIVLVRGETSVRLDVSGLPNVAPLSFSRVRLPGGASEVWAGLVGVIGRLGEGGTRFEPLVTHGGPLPNGAVFQIVQDLGGRVFVGTSSGFVRLALRDDGSADLTPLSRGDELPGNVAGAGSLLDSRGRVWLSTTTGLAVLDPAAEEETPRKPRPLLLERAASTARGTRLLPGTTLRHDDSGVAFEVSLLDFGGDRPPQYRLQLGGLDAEAGAWSEERTLRWTALPPGSYTFRAWGRDHRGVVAGPVELPFYVRRSPLRTPVAYTFYALAAAFLVAATIRLREATLRRMNRALEAQVDARTRELTFARDEALTGSRTKSAFLANMSHELRTPLSAIIGYAELLREDLAETAPRAATDLHRIETAARHQLHLVNEILDLSKIEAGKVELNRTDLDLDALVHEVASTVAPLLEKGKNRLVLDVPEPLGRAHLDALRVKQILLNLLSNASKFTENGTVTLAGRSEGNDVVLCVSDTGIGMTAEQVGRLFKPFTQADAATAARYGGTGLGLTIAKGLSEILGGSLSARAALGKGATFTVRLPREMPDRRKA